MRTVAIIFLFHFSILGYSQSNDISILKSIYENRNSSLDNEMKVISMSVTPISIAVPLFLLVDGYVENKQIRWDNGIITAASITGAMTVTYILKAAVDRERPYDKIPEILPYMRDFSSSFPSGHTTSAFATATSVSLLYPEWYVIAPAFGYAVIVGYSRMHLGMHYPSDVIMGALIGSGVSIINHKLNKLLKPKYYFPRKKPLN